MANHYIFESDRLGFRNWTKHDLQKMNEINSDPEVMEFFPKIATLKETNTFIQKMKAQFKENKYCYFAIDKLEDHSFIGFIGLSRQTYKASFTPCIDIGWRIDKSEWNKGYATEGAKRCLNYGFIELGLEEIVSVAPKVNVKSEYVMRKIGMTKVLEFQHPLLSNFESLKTCVLYKIRRNPS